jgi:ribosomal protein S15P/S13E
MIATQTAADLVFHKDYKEGTVYCIVYTGNGRKHFTTDNSITAVDDILKNLNKTSRTHFVSISDQFSGKIRTYASDSDKKIDEYYNVIFNVKKSGAAVRRRHALNPDVKQYPEDVDIDTVAIEEEEADIKVQEQIIRENPSDFEMSAPSPAPKKRSCLDIDVGVGGAAQPMSDELDNLKAELDKTKTERDGRDNEIADLKQTVSAQNDEIKRLGDNVIQLNDQHVVAVRTIQQARADATTINAGLLAARNALAAAVTEIEGSLADAQAQIGARNASGSAQMPEGSSILKSCSESGKRQVSERSVSPPAKRYKNSELNAKNDISGLHEMTRAELQLISERLKWNNMESKMAKEHMAVSIRNTELKAALRAKDDAHKAELDAHAKAALEAKDQEWETRLKEVISAKDTALSVTADAKTYALKVEADTGTKIRQLDQQLKDKTAENTKLKASINLMDILLAVRDASRANNKEAAALRETRWLYDTLADTKAEPDTANAEVLKRTEELLATCEAVTKLQEAAAAELDERKRVLEEETADFHKKVDVLHEDVANLNAKIEEVREHEEATEATEKETQRLMDLITWKRSELLSAANKKTKNTMPSSEQVERTLTNSPNKTFMFAYTGVRFDPILFNVINSVSGEGSTQVQISIAKGVEVDGFRYCMLQLVSKTDEALVAKALDAYVDYDNWTQGVSVHGRLMVGRSEEGKRMAGRIQRAAATDDGSWTFSLADYLAACNGGGEQAAAAAPPVPAV